jgi:hypothetical protein
VYVKAAAPLHANAVLCMDVCAGCATLSIRRALHGADAGFGRQKAAAANEQPTTVTCPVAGLLHMPLGTVLWLRMQCSVPGMHNSNKQPKMI